MTVYRYEKYPFAAMLVFFIMPLYTVGARHGWRALTMVHGCTIRKVPRSASITFPHNIRKLQAENQIFFVLYTGIKYHSLVIFFFCIQALKNTFSAVLAI